MMSTYLGRLVAKENLTENEMYQLCSIFFNSPKTQQAAALALFAAKNETFQEINGALKYLQEQSNSIIYNEEVIDIVGTGGDKLKTFNISTAASLLMASCGVKVAKHGGRSATSISGSADALEKLGIPFYDNANDIILSLNKLNYAYLCAPLFNPALKSLGALRKELGLPTIFNLLGPIANPIKPKRQIIGVYKKSLMKKIAEVLKANSTDFSLVIHSKDGMDEFSLSNSTYVTKIKNGNITEFEVSPENAGLKKAPLSEVIGGTPDENAKIISGILTGEIKDAKRDIVLLNSAAGLLVAEKVNNLADGVNLAKNAINTGKAKNLLDNLRIGA